MAAAKKSKTARGRKQDRARVAGGQDYEVQYEAKKTGKSAPAVKKAVAAAQQRVMGGGSVHPGTLACAAPDREAAPAFRCAVPRCGARYGAERVMLLQTVPDHELHLRVAEIALCL